MKLKSVNRLVFISVVSMVLGAAIGFYTAQHLKDNRHEQSENEADRSEVVLTEREFLEQFYRHKERHKVVRVRAEELMHQYREDAYGANKKYSDVSLLPGMLSKSIIVTGKIKRIDKEELSYMGYVNQFRTSVVLWGEDSTSHIAKMEENSVEIEDEDAIRRAMAKVLHEKHKKKIVLGGDEVRCAFNRDQTYLLRHLNADDFVEIRGNVVSNSLGEHRNAYELFYYYLNIKNCVLVKHIPSTTSEGKSDASISTD